MKFSIIAGRATSKVKESRRSSGTYHYRIGTSTDNVGWYYSSDQTFVI